MSIAEGGGGGGGIRGQDWNLPIMCQKRQLMYYLNVTYLACKIFNHNIVVT